MPLRSRLLTISIFAVYGAAMVSTNGIFTILDDEGTIVSVAGHPIVPTLRLFLTGGFQHEHPPLSDILLHLWLLATDHSFFALRIFANIFYILGLLLIALAAKKLGGAKAYWTTVVLGCVWPFCFQYARITGWYTCTFFLIAAQTWLYLELLEKRGYLRWGIFSATAILLVWTNYFGVVILFLLLADLLIYHRHVARNELKSLLFSSAAIALSFLPLLRALLGDLSLTASDMSGGFAAKRMVAEIGYPVFSVFGSVAVAPWYLPLSIPVAAAMIALLVSVWFSPGRRWLVYYVLSLALLEFCGHLIVKRMLFLLPWLFLAVGLATFRARFSKLTLASVGTLVFAGWIGIFSGNHYATTNLYEPWNQVAQVVANDARGGATVISESYPFFFYLDYHLGLASETQDATGPDLGEALYRSHGYKVLEPDGRETWLKDLKGKVVLVNGSSRMDSIQWTNAVEQHLHHRCQTLGEYRAAPDPAFTFKARYASGVPVMPYRTAVTWFDCPRRDRPN